MEIQTTFLDKIPTDEPEEKAQPVNEDLKNWALVYLVTYAGGNSGNLFVLKKEDAMKFCEDDCSHGFGRGGEWMMQWTSLDHFAEQGAESARKQNENVHGRLEPFVFIRDTGKQDKDFERLGIAKPTLEENRRLVNEMGYELTYKGSPADLIANGTMTEKEYRDTEKQVEQAIKDGAMAKFLGRRR